MINKINTFLNKGQTRTVLAKKNILYSFLIKLSNIFIVMTTVSISIKLLGAKNYGVWIVLSGIITWSNLFNLGFSNGLRNKLGEALANNNKSLGQYYVSTTYAFLALVSIVMMTFFLTIFYSLDWVTLLNINGVDNDFIISILLIIFSFFCLQFLLGPINAILEAHQWPSVVQLFALIGGATILIVLYFSTALSFRDYAYVVAGIPVAILFLVTLILFTGKYKDIRPQFSKVRKKYFSSLSKLGIAFFILQLNAIVILQTDNLIVSNIFGPEKVTEYNIAQRYFSLIITFFLVVIAPYWSAVTNAYVKNDFVWIRKSTNKLFQFVIVSVFVVFIMYLISDWFYSIWIGKDIIINPTLSALMAVYVLVFCFVSIFSHFSNGIGALRVQIVINTFAALVNIPLSFYFASTSLGISGVILATICSVSLMGLVLIIQYYKVITKKAEGIWIK